MEKLFRSRVARGVFAAALVAVGLWGFAPYLLHDVATSAYVNAELTRVSTPVAGVLTDGLPTEGAYIRRNAHLRLVTARTPDRSRLDDLEQQTSLAASSVGLVRTQLEEIRQEDAELGRRSAFFRDATLQQLDDRRRQAKADLAGCAARLQEQQDKLARTRQLAAKGFVSDAALRSSQDTFDSGRESCNSASAALDAVKTQTNAASRGVYLNDGNNDAPYAEQQRGRLMLRRQELMTELVRGQAALSQLQGQLAQERARFARAANYEAVLPADHLVWNVEARPGSDVAEGQPLMELADCRNRFLVVELPARKIEHLTVGDPARVRLLGSNRWMSGQVRRITGGAAQQDKRMFAANIPKPGPHSFSVEVSLSGTEPTAGRRSCDIGRTADVRFGGGLGSDTSSRVAALDSAGGL